MNVVTYFFKLWLNRRRKWELKMYFETYAPFEWFDALALEAVIALAED